MTALVMMYVYYDSDNEIRAISPIKEQQYINEGCKRIAFPLSEVEDFITAKKNPYNYFIEHRRRDGIDTYKIVAKVVNTTYVRSIDNYLTQIKFQNKEINAIRIENNVKEKKLYFYISEGLKNKINGAYYQENDDVDDDEYDKLDAFKLMRSIGFYFTYKDDPTFLIKTVNIVPMELIKESCLVFSYEEDLRNVSVYTKKIFTYYSYREKKDYGI